MAFTNADKAGFGFLFFDIGRLLRRNMSRRAQHLGLTQEQLRALFVLARTQGTTQVALAEQLDIQPITLARILDRLQESRLIERRACPTDRRAFEIYLTPAANPLLDELSALGIQTREEALAGLSAEDIHQLMELLQTVKYNLSLAEMQGVGPGDLIEQRA